MSLNLLVNKKILKISNIVMVVENILELKGMGYRDGVKRKEIKIGIGMSHYCTLKCKMPTSSLCIATMCVWMIAGFFCCVNDLTPIFLGVHNDRIANIMVTFFTGMKRLWVNLLTPIFV